MLELDSIGEIVKRHAIKTDNMQANQQAAVFLDIDNKNGLDLVLAYSGYHLKEGVGYFKT